jgi:hypothetical protein
LLVLALGTARGATLARAPISVPQLADYDAELRLANGRVDTDTLVQRLSALGVTTYYWLINHASTDWNDLQIFLPKAARAGIQVWVYLVPPSETPPASQPFGTNYRRWGQEIAKLSLSHSNLTGWVIDDFWPNAIFTQSYVRQMQTAAKTINPRLAFLPLLYFPQVGAFESQGYASLVDGVIVAYPESSADITSARQTLGSLPFIVMTAAQPYEYQVQYGSTGTPQAIASLCQVCLEAMQAGECDGVVTYALDLTSSDGVYPLIQSLFQQLR